MSMEKIKLGIALISEGLHELNQDGHDWNSSVSASSQSSDNNITTSLQQQQQQILVSKEELFTQILGLLARLVSSTTTNDSTITHIPVTTTTTTTSANVVASTPVSNKALEITSESCHSISSEVEKSLEIRSIRSSRTNSDEQEHIQIFEMESPYRYELGTPNSSSDQSSSSLKCPTLTEVAGLSSATTTINDDSKLSHMNRNGELMNPIQKRQLRVLLVDDDQVSSNLLCRRLRALKIDAVHASSGMSALLMLLQRPTDFDLILCDVSMPGLDGGQVLRGVLSIPQISRVPIVMISAADNMTVAQDLVAAGAKDYLVKPVYASSLASLVLRLQGWVQQDMEAHFLHLRALYSVTEGLMMQLRCGIDLIDADMLTNSSSTNNSTSSSFEDAKVLTVNPSQNLVTNARTGNNITENITVRALTCVVASKELQSLIGITDDDITKERVDMLSYVDPRDISRLKEHILKLIFQDPNREEKIHWSWRDASRPNSYIPVSGKFVSLGDGTVVVESKSMLPTLLYMEERERREIAENNWRRMTEKNEQMEKSFLRQARITKLATAELQSMINHVSDLARASSSNPHAITWKVEKETGKILYVSPIACERFLQYSDSELVGTQFESLVAEEDRSLCRYLMSKIGNKATIRRSKKDGTMISLSLASYYSGGGGSGGNGDLEYVIFTEFPETPTT